MQTESLTLEQRDPRATPASGIRGSLPCGVTILVGEASGALQAAAKRAAKRAFSELHFEPSITDAAARLQNGAKAATVLIPYAPGRMAETAVAMHSLPGLADSITVAVADELDDVIFEEVFSAGFDDCIVATEAALTTTLRAVERGGRHPVRKRPETVVVADACRASRVAIARSFRLSGFAIVFAADPAELAAAGAIPDAAVIIVERELAERAAEEESLSQWAGSVNRDAAWIINTPPRAMNATGARIGDNTQIAIGVHDSYATPSSLLFVANALRNNNPTDLRRAPRMLYGTATSFRAAGRTDGHVGFTYNVSVGGAYIRTLCPPEVGEKLWLELVPPRSAGLVHLEATVVWRRGLANEADAVVPPGFGVRFTGGSASDLAAVRMGCTSFAKGRC